MSSVVGTRNRKQNYVVALLCVDLARAVEWFTHNAAALASLNLPMNNCAILQKGNELQLLTAGQHVIIDPNVTLRGMFTCGENQIEMPTKGNLFDQSNRTSELLTTRSTDIFTRDQVPVGLKIYLKWCLHPNLPF
jgi:hypothetical protein